MASGRREGKWKQIWSDFSCCCNQISVLQSICETVFFSYLHYPLAPLVADLALLERIIVSDEAFNFHTC